MLLSLVTLLLHVSPELEEGRAASSSLKYTAAIAALSKVTSSDAPSAEKAEAYGLLARAWLALGKPANAQAAFEGLLTEDPMAEEPAGAPKVKQAFLAAKRARFPPGTVQLVKRPSGADALVLDLVNPWRLPVSVVAWEATTGEFVKKPVVLDGLRAVLALPAGSRTWVQAVDPSGKSLATFASAAEPVPGPPAPPAAAVATAPRPDAPVEVKTTPSSPSSPLPAVASAVEPGLSATRLTGFVLIGVGALAMIVGGIVAGLGFADYAKGNGFPFTVEDPFEAERLKTQGTTEQWAGGVTGGGGVLALISGIVLVVVGSQSP